MEHFLSDHFLLAIVMSLSLNTFIAIMGVIPSTFLTAANILYFGFYFGLTISLLGEALGAVVSFYLYRKGMLAVGRKVKLIENNRFIRRLKETNGSEAVVLVLGLRIFPFVPSGLVTLGASISQMKLVTFAMVSTLGKIPALFIEAYSIHTMINLKTETQIVLGFTVLFLVFTYYLVKKAVNGSKKI